MAGPGGGSRGGGGFSGGSRGGFSGGSRGGFSGGMRGGYHHRPPMHHHHMPHMHYGGFGPRRHYHHHGGGGCLGAMFAPIIVIIVIIGTIFSFTTGDVHIDLSSGHKNYDEATFQAYADAQYSELFGSSSAYEDNILIVLLTNEDADEYYFIGWVGDHIERDINYMFGNEQTELGNALYSNINLSGYWYSLDSNLANAVEMLTDDVKALGLESSFTCNEAHSAKSQLVNKTTLSLTEETVETALEAFTAETGIPICIVVDEMDNVFGKQSLGFTTSKTSPLLIVLIVLAVVTIIFIIVKSKNDKVSEKKDRGYYEDEYKGPEID